MDLIEGMMTLRSIRRFTDEPVTDEEIWTCLRAAVQAPNGGNAQPWHWLVVTDSDRRKRIGEVYRRAFARYWPAVMSVSRPPRTEAGIKQVERMTNSAQHLAEHMGDAPAIAMLLSPPHAKVEFRDEQGALDIGSHYTSLLPSLQNFLLAARAQGIGTCLTTLYRIHQDDMREICGIPAEFEIEALIPMGRPRGRFGVAPRRPAERVTSWNTFGEQRSPSS